MLICLIVGTKNNLFQKTGVQMGICHDDIILTNNSAFLLWLSVLNCHLLEQVFAFSGCKRNATFTWAMYLNIVGLGENTENHNQLEGKKL